MSEPLSKEQIEELTHVLRAGFKSKRAEIRESLLNSDNEQYIQLAGKVHDFADESVADLLTDVNYAVIDIHIKEIRAMEQALMNIGKGSYGICTDCNENIGYARIKVEPTATRCLNCQEEYEKYQDQISPHATL